MRRGVKVRGFATGPATNGTPHVVGVETDDGVLRADLVVDAMGRRSPAVELLGTIGARPPLVQSQDSGYTYYTRYFTGTQPALMAPPVTAIGSFMVLTIWGDNSTWSVTLWAPSGDRALKQFRDPEKFERVVRACPLHAHWLDGTPISDVLPMAGILDRYHRFVVDDAPIATGYAAVGDAWACTNPSAGRGLSIGLMHAQRLRDAVHAELDDPYRVRAGVGRGHRGRDRAVVLAPARHRRARLDEMDAVREGRADVVQTIVPLPPQYEAAVAPPRSMPTCSAPCSRPSAASPFPTRCSHGRACGTRCWPRARTSGSRCRAPHATSWSPCWVDQPVDTLDFPYIY